jgi:hypothetical protein
MVVPVGSTAVITALGIELITGAAGGVLSTKTIAIGAGALAAAGGIAAVAASSGDGGNGGDGGKDGDNFSFTGRFVESGGDWQKAFTLQQNGDSISGTLRWDSQDDECACYFETVVTGYIVDTNTASLSWNPAQEYCSCGGGPFELSGYQEEGVTNRRATLENNGKILYIEAWGEFYRQ